MSKIEFENRSGCVSFDCGPLGALDVTIFENGKDQPGATVGVDLNADNVQELTSYLIGTSATNSYAAESNEPSYQQSAYDTVLRAIDQWHREGVNTFSEPLIQTALAALLIAHKAKQDPAAVMEAHLAEQARMRREDQWLDTYNAAIAQPTPYADDAATLERATRLADATHGGCFQVRKL